MALFLLFQLKCSVAFLFLADALFVVDWTLSDIMSDNMILECDSTKEELTCVCCLRTNRVLNPIAKHHYGTEQTLPFKQSFCCVPCFVKARKEGTDARKAGKKLKKNQAEREAWVDEVTAWEAAYVDSKSGRVTQLMLPVKKEVSSSRSTGMFVTENMGIFWEQSFYESYKKQPMPTEDAFWVWHKGQQWYGVCLDKAVHGKPRGTWKVGFDSRNESTSREVCSVDADAPDAKDLDSIHSRTAANLAPKFEPSHEGADAKRRPAFLVPQAKKARSADSDDEDFLNVPSLISNAPAPPVAKAVTDANEDTTNKRKGKTIKAKKTRKKIRGKDYVPYNKQRREVTSAEAVLRDARSLIADYQNDEAVRAICATMFPSIMGKIDKKLETSSIMVLTYERGDSSSSMGSSPETSLEAVRARGVAVVKAMKEVEPLLKHCAEVISELWASSDGAKLAKLTGETLPGIETPPYLQEQVVVKKWTAWKSAGKLTECIDLMDEKAKMEHGICSLPADRRPTTSAKYLHRLLKDAFKTCELPDIVAITKKVLEIEYDEVRSDVQHILHILQPDDFEVGLIKSSLEFLEKNSRWNTCFTSYDAGAKAKEQALDRVLSGEGDVVHTEALDTLIAMLSQANGDADTLQDTEADTDKLSSKIANEAKSLNAAVIELARVQACIELERA